VTLGNIEPQMEFSMATSAMTSS